jgi:hypothetical protein
MNCPSCGANILPGAKVCYGCKRPLSIPPEKPEEFFPWFKSESEKLWARMNASYENSTWLPGLTERQIADFEKDIGFTFPDIYKTYLRFMNGTTIFSFTRTHYHHLRGSDPIDFYTAEEKEEVYSHLFHSYPRDLGTIRREIGEVCERFTVKPNELDQREIPHIMPFMSGKFLVIDRCEGNPVLSIYPDEEVGIFTNSLEKYLAFSILGLRLDSSIEEIYVKFWVDYDDGIIRCPECGMDTVNPIYSGFWIFKKVIAFSCYNEACPARGKPFEFLIHP